MNSRYLAVADIAGRVCICLYFIPALITRVIFIQQTFARADLTSIDVVTAAASFASVLFLGMICVVTITRLPPLRSAESTEGYITAMAGTFLLVVVAGYLPPVEMSIATRSLGLALTIIGLLASVYVLFFLGRAFSIMPEARTLVASGPYSIVRHPLYLTEEIAVIGLITMNLSIWSVSLGVIHWLIQLRRMVNEERVLRATFPDYDSYAQAVPRIMPFTNAGKLRSAA
ncbi:isoprenylcysteine carboxylmethyltransferase family protein [Pararhizobium sp. A13]|uniref:methyltransferase family protein n=1 Tax=Pararhizobium sp. A13 TaxID=3133975 RepID=UPI00324B1185